MFFLHYFFCVFINYNLFVYLLIPKLFVMYFYLVTLSWFFSFSPLFHHSLSFRQILSFRLYQIVFQYLSLNCRHIFLCLFGHQSSRPVYEFYQTCHKKTRFLFYFNMRWSMDYCYWVFVYKVRLVYFSRTQRPKLVQNEFRCWRRCIPHETLSN